MHDACARHAVCCIDCMCRLYIDDVLLGSKGVKLSVKLTAGYHKVVLTYVEYTGSAMVSLQWNNGNGDQ